MKENEENLKLLNDTFDSFGEQNYLSNKNINKLTSSIIKSEEKKKKLSQDLTETFIQNNDNNLFYNILILLLIILIISSSFFFKNLLIFLKKNYLSNQHSFIFNIFYSNADFSFLLFIILTCTKTISTGMKLLMLQSIAYILCFITILIKNKINKSFNNFKIDKVIFHCSDIFISFLFLGEKLQQISEENSFNIFIYIILLIFNINILIYFVLVEIINCPYDEIIIDIVYGIIISVVVFYSIFYIMKIKIKPKKIISLILSNIISSVFINIFFIFILFYICLIKNKLEYFFANKILMKSIGFLIYEIFELYYFFGNNEKRKFRFFYLYNIYSNRYIYSGTSYTKTFLRVIISVVIEHYLLSKLDFTYKNGISTINSFLILFFDIIHGFLVLFLIKFIFNIINLNNKILLEVDINKPFMRYGSFMDGKKGDPLFFIE